MMEVAEANLSFDPGTLTDLKNDDSTPFFSEEQIGRLAGFDKFKGERGQAHIVKSLMELESLKGLSDKTLSQLKTDKETYESEVGEKYKGHLSPPKEDATDEEKAEWSKSVKAFLKAPEDLDGYNKLKLPESIDEESVAALKELAYANHWTEASTQKAIDIHQSLLEKSVESFHADQEEAQKTTDKILTKLWGGQKNKVEKVEQIRRMLREYVNPDWRSTDIEMDELWKDFDKKVYASGVGNNDVIMAILSEAVDKGVGRKEGNTVVEMHGSVPVVKGGRNETPQQEWDRLNPGVEMP